MNNLEMWETQFSWLEEEVFKLSLNLPLNKDDILRAEELSGRIKSLKREILNYEQT